MATKYVDQGAYNTAGSFSAGTSGSSTTLTLTTPGSFTGTLSPGMLVTGTGLTAGDYITAVTYNATTGVVNSVTLSTARTVSAGTTITTSSPESGTSSVVPIWGSAQDGDGTAKDVGTPSTAEIVFTGVPTTGTIAVCGVTVSPAWATSADNCADLLATAINASTTTAAGPASFTIKSQLRNHVYARGPSRGAPAGTCQVMTRQASADHAGLIAITHTLDNVSSSATINWSGGTGGCWGYLYNAYAIWPSAVAGVGYGLWGASKPYTGTVAAGDLIKVRSNKNIIWRGISGAGIPTLSAMGTVTSPVLFLIDNSSEWSDGSEPQLIMTFSANNYSPGLRMTQGSTFAHIKASKYSDTKYGVLIRTYTDGTASWYFMLNASSGSIVEGFDLDSTLNTAADAPSTFFPTQNGGFSYGDAVWINCRFKSKANSSYVTTSGSTLDDRTRMVNCIFESTYTSSAHSGVFTENQVYGRHGRVYENCRFIGFTPNSNLFSTNFSSGSEQQYTFINCDFGSVTVWGPYVSGTTTNRNCAPYEKIVAIYSQVGNRDFALDTSMGTVEWNSARSYPVLNAKLLDGTTGWAIYAVPHTSSTYVNPCSPLSIPRIAKINSLDAGTRTATVELAVHDSITPTTAFISARFQYTTTSGTQAMVDTYVSAALATTLTTSSSTWSNESAGKVYFPYTAQSLSKYKLTASLPDLQTGVEVSCLIFINGPVVDVAKGILIDPEIVLV